MPQVTKISGVPSLSKSMAVRRPGPAPQLPPSRAVLLERAVAAIAEQRVAHRVPAIGIAQFSPRRLRMPRSRITRWPASVHIFDT